MMPKRVLGNTGIEVSCLGLGTVKLGRNAGVHYPVDFALPDDQAILQLLTCAQELGINLLDTAPAYGTSEERLGKLLQHRRHEFVISTKAGEEFIKGISHYDFSPQVIVASVERSLQRLHTDFIDILLIHSNGDDEKIIRDDDVFNTLDALKQSGKIRAVGMSTKTVAGGLLALQYADVVMVTYNPLQPEDKAVISEAHRLNKGVFIKKALASGHLNKISQQEPVLQSLNYVFQEPGVSSVIVGTLNPEHLRYNAKCLELVIFPSKSRPDRI